MEIEIKYLQEKDINHWGLANDYADKIHPCNIVGVSTLADAEQHDIIKTAYEQGMLKATELLKEHE